MLILCLLLSQGNQGEPVTWCQAINQQNIDEMISQLIR